MINLPSKIMLCMIEDSLESECMFSMARLMFELKVQTKLQVDKMYHIASFETNLSEFRENAVIVSIVKVFGRGGSENWCQ